MHFERYAGLKYVQSPADVPAGPHLALLVYSKSSVLIPGDERSRTNPGHGYPERTETYNTFEHYVTQAAGATDRDYVTKAVDYVRSQRDPFVVLEVAGKLDVVVTTTLQLTAAAEAAKRPARAARDRNDTP